MAPKPKKEEPIQHTSDSEPVLPSEEVLVEGGSVEQENICGHVNLQHYGTSGRLEKIACDLKAGHAGDHHARYMRNVGEPVTDEKGRVVKVTYHEEAAHAFWGDAAGKPAMALTDPEMAQTSLLQKDMIMDALKHNPNLTAEQAMSQAKAKPEWNIGNEPG